MDYEKLLWDILSAHRDHRIVVATYGDIDDPVDVCLECEDCCEVLIDAWIYTICAREDV